LQWSSSALVVQTESLIEALPEFLHSSFARNRVNAFALRFIDKDVNGLTCLELPFGLQRAEVEDGG